MTSRKSGTSFQNKLVKRNEINRLWLARELSQIEESEKSDVRMLETARQRFRSRYKKLRLRLSPSDFDAIDVRMYETHNPGFCYHCMGAMKENSAGLTKKMRENCEDSYDVIEKMLFTDGEVDINKILCLHLLTAHIAKPDDIQVPGLEVDSATFDKGLDKSGRRPLTGAWNNLLPCYIIEIRQDSDSTNPEDSTDRLKRHHDPFQISMETETLRNFERSYERYVGKNQDIVSALTANDRLARIAPKALGKMPIISPHVYSLLGASHELRVKQAFAESDAGKRYYNKRSNVDLKMFDGKSFADSFRLLDERDDDRYASKIILGTSARDWSSGPGFPKMSGIKSNSRRSTFGSNYKDDLGITMFGGKLKRHVEEVVKTWETGDKEGGDDFVTIKPSNKIVAAAPSKTSSTKSPFRTMQDGPTYSMNSFDSIPGSPRYSTKKYKKCVYLNSPVKRFALRAKEHRTVNILVNNQIQALVHSVLDVLEKVNCGRFRKIVEAAGDFGKIREIFARRDIQNFLETLMNQPLVSSPDSFVLSAATAVEEIDTRLECFVEDELVATSLELPAVPILAILLEEIRDSIFVKKKNNPHAASVDLSDERSKAAESLSMMRTEESELTKSTIVENQRQISSGYDGTRINHKMPMRRETNDHAIANKRGKKSNEGNQVVNEIIKVEGNLVTKIPEKIRNEIMKDLTSKKVRRPENETPPKVRKPTQETAGYLDPERVILRRMTNEQRIMVGRMCAALKNRRINNEGLIKERTPLAAIITPVLSRESIKMLTRGTTYADKSVDSNKSVEEKDEQTVARMDKLTGPILAKVRRDIAERETKRRLDDFFTK